MEKKGIENESKLIILEVVTYQKKKILEVVDFTEA
jgi:hypothetical protein